MMRTRNHNNQRKLKKELFQKKLYEKVDVPRGRHPRIVDRSIQTNLTMEQIQHMEDLLGMP